jgi:hypothetical protein
MRFGGGQAEGHDGSVARIAGTVHPRAADAVIGLDPP